MIWQSRPDYSKESWRDADFSGVIRVDECVGDCAFTDLLHEPKSTGRAKLNHAYSSALGGSVIAVCI
jgi:hypothetical protein